MSNTLLATTLLVALGQMPAGSYPGSPAPGAAMPGNAIPGTAYPDSQIYPVPDNGAAYSGGDGAGYQSGGAPANPYFGNPYANYRLNPANQPASPGGGPVADPLFNYDAYEPWVHGYWQELPAFGGYAYYRPYNYRHVYVQSEVAASWQTSGQMPYSQEYYRRAREQGILEQRTSSIGRPGLPLAYRQRPRTERQPEIIAKASAERPAQQKPAARQPVRNSLFKR